MQTSLFIAKLMGPIMIALGATLLINRDRFVEIGRQMIDNPALLLLNGALTLTAGLAVVLTHNVWSANWPVIITIFGWLMVIAGVMRTVFPVQITGIGEKMIGFLEKGPALPVVAAIYVLLGAFLSYQGYFA